MTRQAPPSTYDDDFFAWTQEQATALRQMPQAAIGDHVDIEHVAEEIEDLGKRDLREVSSFLERLVEHLLKIDGCPGSRDLIHWRAEARNFRRRAAKAFSPSMRQLLDTGRIWRDGRRAASELFNDLGVTLSAPLECPFDVDEMLSDDFDLDKALAKIDRAKAASTRGAI